MQRKTPKVLLKDPITRYLVGLSRDLHMTYGRLCYELDRFGGRSEVGLQMAYDEREMDARNERQERAHKDAAGLERLRQFQR